MNTKALVALSMLLSLTSAFPQGSLAPPGAPAPTMKTLDQIEPRTVINAKNTPGDAKNTFIIRLPGSYYLGGNLTGTAGKNGILINSDDVTIDLEGFAVTCAVAGQNSLAGILDSGGHHNLAIYHGTIRGWGIGNVTLTSTGVELHGLRLTNSPGDGGVSSPGDGVNARNGNKLLIADCVASNNSGDGFSTGVNASVTHCIATGNTRKGFAGKNCTITDCGADLNDTGFSCSGGGNFSHCSAVGPGQITGFLLGDNSMATDCVATGNMQVGFFALRYCQLTCCVSSSNGTGMYAADGSSVTGCTVSANTGYGINAIKNCLITNNNASLNGGNGFQSTSGLNRVDSNTATGNTGHGFVWGNDYLVRNTAFGNTGGDYSPTPGAGNSGPVQAASSATSPWANF